MEVTTATNRVELSVLFEGVLGQALAEGSGAWVALAVGGSTLPMYRRLPAEDPVWRGRRITPLDELVPPPARAEAAFSARLRSALPEPIRDLVVPIDTRSPRAEAARLESDLREDGLAVAVCGLGPDGHVAFNLPGSRVGASRVVELPPDVLSRLIDSEPAKAAVTVGIATLLSARQLILVVAGAGKQDALGQFCSGSESPRWPVTYLRRHPRLHVLHTPAQ
jgi:glucosamine-6-phosphate deaminase